MRTDHTSQRFAVISCAALALALVALVLWRCQAPSARGPDAPTGEFSSERAIATLRRVLGDEAPHPGGVAAHAAVRERLLGELRALGLVPEVQETLVRGESGRIAVVRNVLANVGPPGGDTILLCAHYDSVGAGPGASDDGAGVATLLEVARALGAQPALARPVMLLFTDGEEAGLLGASAFVDQHPRAADVGVVLNLEARGTGGPSMLFETSGENGPLIDAFARSSRRPWTTSVAELVYKNMPNDTDLSVFRRAGIPGFNFAFIDGLSRYHTPLDDLAHLEPGSVQHHGDNALALVVELAARGSASRGPYVFADVASLGVVRWPLHWSAPLACGVLALTAVALIAALRRGSVRAGELVSATWRVLAAMVLAVAVPSAIAAMLSTSARAPDFAAAHPWPARAVLAATALASFALLARGPSPLAVSWSVAIWLALGAVAAAITLPETSYLVLLPAAAAALCAPIAIAARPRSARAFLVAVPAAALATLLWLPVACAMEYGFNYALPALVAAPASVACATWSPLFAALSKPVARGIAIAAAGCALIASVIAAMLPPRSIDDPGWLNLRYIDDSERTEGRWEASTFGAELPESFVAAGWQPASSPPFPWLSFDRSLHVQSAPKSSMPLPRLEVVAVVPTPDGRRVRCRATSPRGAVRLHLHVDERVSILSATWRGRRIESGFDGVVTQLFFAVDGAGVELELAVRGGAPAEIWLLDQDWAMPPEFDAVRALRPADWTPRSDGDVSILGTRVEL